MIIRHLLNISMLLFCVIMACSSTEEQKPQPYTQTGEASFYASSLEGNSTADGSIFSNDSLTAAHNALPFGTVVKVTNLENDQEVTVKINDRGPYAAGRIIDLSKAAAQHLDMLDDGIAEVKVEVIQPAPGYSVSDSVASP